MLTMKATTLDTPRVCDVRHLKMGSVPDLYLGLDGSSGSSCDCAGSASTRITWELLRKNGMLKSGQTGQTDNH
jgi:hypothetical protein